MAWFNYRAVKRLKITVFNMEPYLYTSDTNVGAAFTHRHTHHLECLFSHSWWREKKDVKNMYYSTWEWNWSFRKHFARMSLRNEGSFGGRAFSALPIGSGVCIKTCWQLWEQVPTFIWCCLALQLTSPSPSPLAGLLSLLIRVASHSLRGTAPAMCLSYR